MAVDLNYGVGVEGKNLVLKTLGRVYVKVKDRKYELLFRPEDLQNAINEYLGNSGNTVNNDSSVIIVSSELELPYIEYPGDNKLVVTKNGRFFFTSNGIYTEITFSFDSSNLTVQNLTVSGQINFTGNGIPFVVNNTKLISNLNADLLDGYHANQFAIKNANEQISGNWTYSGTPTFNTAIGTNKLTDPSENKIKIDFSTGVITCTEIVADNLNYTKPTKFQGLVSGIGNEVWIGVELNIVSFSQISNEDIENNNFDMLSAAYNNETLPNYIISGDDTIEWPLIDFWYNKIFFDKYDVSGGTYTLKNFNDQATWDTINQNFTGTLYDLRDFQNIIYALYDYDYSAFTGNYYVLETNEILNLRAINRNMIVKDMNGTVGVIVSISSSSVVIRLKDTGASFSGDKLIVIGSLAYNGGIVFKSNDPSLSILSNSLDESSRTVYFGELSRVDTSKSGIGMILSGLYPTTVVADNTLDNIKNYQHTTSINIDNPYIKWGNHIVTLNEDGSGLLSQGQIRWSSHKDLVVDGSDIINSRINQCTISDSILEDDVTYSGIWTNDNIPILNNDRLPSTISSKILSSCNLDCNCTIPDCLLHNRTYDNITITNSVIDSSTILPGVVTEEQMNGLLEALRKRESSYSSSVGSNSIQLDPWIHQYYDFQEVQGLIDTTGETFIDFLNSSSYSTYFPKLTKFWFMYKIPSKNSTIYFTNQGSSFSSERVENSSSADLNGQGIDDNGRFYLNFGIGGGTSGYVYVIDITIAWGTRRIHALIH